MLHYIFQVINLSEFSDDATCFLESLSLPVEDEDYENFHHVNVGPSGRSSKADTQREYFGQLTKDLMKKVYHRYLPDYLLYGYDYDTYFKYAKDAAQDELAY